MGKKIDIDEKDKVLQTLLKGHSDLERYNEKMKEIWDKVILDKRRLEVKYAKVKVEERDEQSMSENDGELLPEEEVRDFMRFLGIAEEKYCLDETVIHWSSWIKKLKAEGKYDGTAQRKKAWAIKADEHAKNKIRSLKKNEILNRVFGGREITIKEINKMSKGWVALKLDELVDEDKISEAVEYLKGIIKDENEKEDKLRAHVDRKIEDTLGAHVDSKIKEIIQNNLYVFKAFLNFVGAGIFGALCLFLAYQISRVAYGVFKAIVGL
jgi:hypothetical protein